MTSATAPATVVTTTATAGRGWARFGFGVGVSASVAANVAHSYVPPPGVSDSWTPPAGAIVAAAFWPLALVIAIESIQRVRWPGGWMWKATRWGGMTTVAGIAAVISYRHLSGLMTAYGEDPLSSTIGPLAVDGLMVVCSAAMLAISDNVRRQPVATGDSATAGDIPPATAGRDSVAPGNNDSSAPSDGDSRTDDNVVAPPRRRRAPRHAAAENELARQAGTRQHGLEMARQGSDADAIVAALGVSLRSAQRYVKAAKKPA